MSFAFALGAQASDVSFKALRYEEDYSSLRDEPPSRAFADRLKFIPLDATGGAWLTLGGESRSRYEYFSHAQWGAGPQDEDGYFLQRTMLHADWHLAEAVRVFVQLKSGLEAGRNGGPRSTDEDRFDLNQAFVDARWPVTADATLTLRVGRQEIALGSSRLVSTREAPNVHLTFDGARVFLQHKGWRIDALAVRPAQTRPGSFDDSPDRTQKLWGLYAVTPFPKWSGANLDIYYLGYERDSGRFAQGAAHENRQTFGSRLWGKRGDWDYNGEAVLQFGRFGGDQIHAWLLSLDTSYTFSAATGKSRLGVRGGIASGDRDPDDGELNTYNGLFPRGAYFHESGLIGPANIIAVDAFVTVQASAAVNLSADCNFFWRQSEHDGVYGSAVNLVRPALTTPGRSLGTQPSVRVEWRPTRHWLVAATFARFYAGEVIRGSGPGRDVDYVSTWTTCTF
ncbi:MAG: alginate export family protein [Verrucomicrobia bacterium]|nr:alginate export family protein [Verrucomicrobiota bacterium]